MMRLVWNPLNSPSPTGYSCGLRQTHHYQKFSTKSPIFWLLQSFISSVVISGSLVWDLYSRCDTCVWYLKFWILIGCDFLLWSTSVAKGIVLDAGYKSQASKEYSLWENYTFPGNNEAIGCAITNVHPEKYKHNIIKTVWIAFMHLGIYVNIRIKAQLCTHAFI